MDIIYTHGEASISDVLKELPKPPARGALGRLLAILDGGRNRRALTRLSVLLAVILVAAVAVPLAALKATGPEQPVAPKPDEPATQPTTQPAASAEKASTLAICVIANISEQGGRGAMISAEEAAKWRKQLADQGPIPPKDHQRYWWAQVGESMMPPPQALIADYRGKPYILLCADWPRALTPWRDPPFRSGILSASAIIGSDGKHAVQVVLDKEARQAISFIGKAYKGLTVACAVDGIVRTIETITDPLNETPVVAGGMTKPQAEALARGLLAGMPAVKALRDAIQDQNLQDTRALLDANPALANAACDWPPGGDAPLHQAAYTNIDIVRLLLDRGANVNAPRKRDRQTPLHLAVTNERDQIIRLLLDRGASLKAADNQGFTPLHHAAMHFRASTARTLLDAGADVNCAGKAGVTPLDMIVLMDLHQRTLGRRQGKREDFGAIADLLRQRGGKVGIIGAAAMGDADAVRGILKTDPGAVNMAALGHMSPLCVAAMAGHVSVVKLLLDAGAAVNSPERSPASPLMVAAGAGHLDVVKLLVARGADVNAAGEGTALTAAAYQGHREIVQFLLEKGARPDDLSGDGSALTAAASSAQVEIVKLLLDRGMAVNARTKQGRTALITLAASTWPEPPAKGVMETAKLLIERGADVNARDSQDRTALSYAFAHESRRPINADLVKLLIDHGANVNVGAIVGGGTLLHVAAEKDNPGAAKLLIDAGADLFAEDSSIMGRTPLEVAEQNKANRAAEVIGKAVEPRLGAMRAKVIESLQPFLEAISKADAKAAMARVITNPQVSRAMWQNFIDAQCKAISASPSRLLVPGEIEIRNGFAAAAVTDAEARPGKQTVIVLLECEDGSWRPVKSDSADIDGIEQTLKRSVRDAGTFLGAMRLAARYKAGKLTGPAPNSSFGSGIPSQARKLEITASGGTLIMDCQAADPQQQWSVETAPDRTLYWMNGKRQLAWGRTLTLTGNAGLALEASGGKITVTRGESKTVLQAVGDSVQMTNGDNAVSASKVVLDLSTMKVLPATQPGTTTEMSPAAPTSAPAKDANAAPLTIDSIAVPKKWFWQEDGPAPKDGASGWWFDTEAKAFGPNHVPSAEPAAQPTTQPAGWGKP